MKEDFNLNRFLNAQEWDYTTALQEIQMGRKYSHWIWYIFPQMRGLGRSHNSEFYGISSIDEAIAYLNEPILNSRLREITLALLSNEGKSAREILGDIDARKVCSSMTLFDMVSPNDIFAQVLDKFYEGRRCGRTIRVLDDRNAHSGHCWIKRGGGNCVS